VETGSAVADSEPSEFASIAPGKVPVSTIGVESGTVVSVIVTIDGWGGAGTASGRSRMCPAVAASDYSVIIKDSLPMPKAGALELLVKVKRHAIILPEFLMDMYTHFNATTVSRHAKNYTELF
jgi:hypothetical protein